MTKDKSTLLITGAGGWLGSSLIELTKEKFFRDSFNKVILCTFSSKEIDTKYSIEVLSKDNSINYTWLIGDLFLDKFYFDLANFLQKDEDLKVIYSASVIHAKSSKDFFKINNRALEKFVKKYQNIIFQNFYIFPLILLLDSIMGNPLLTSNLNIIPSAITESLRDLLKYFYFLISIIEN